MISRRELLGASLLWLVLAIACVGLDVPYLHPVVVGGYLLTIPGSFSTLAVSPDSPRIEATTLGVLSVIFSLAWVAVVTIALTAMSVPLAYLLPVSGIWIGALSLRVRPVSIAVDYGRREGIALAAVVGAVVAVVAVPHLLSARVSLSAHGALHSSIAYGVVNGNVPPMHPGFAYEPYTAYYWVYHVILAGFSETLGVVPVLASLVLAWASIAGISLLLYRLARVPFGLSPRVAGIALLGPIWAMSTVVPASALVLGTDIRETPLLAGRIGLFIEKFVTISGFPLGLFLFASMLFLLLQSLSEGGSTRRTWAGFVAAGVLLFHVHTTTALFAFPALGLATVVAVWSRDRPQRVSKPDWTPFFCWAAIGLGCLPFVYALLSAGAGSQSIQFFASRQRAIGPVTLEGAHAQYLYNARNIVIPFLVAGPLAVLGYAALRAQRPQETRIVGVVALAVAAIGTVVSLPDANQYKVAYVLALPVAPLAAVGLQQLADRLESTRPLLVALFVAIVLLNPAAYLVTGPAITEYAADRNYEFDGTDVRLSNSAPVDPAPFEWVADETPPNSSIVVSPTVYDELQYQPSNVQTSLIVAALTERNLYYAHRELPPHLLPEDARSRERAVTRLLACDDRALQFPGLEGPLYAIATTEANDQGCDLYRHLEESDRWTHRISKGSIGVFEYTPDSSA